MARESGGTSLQPGSQLGAAIDKNKNNSPRVANWTPNPTNMLAKCDNREYV